MRILRTIGGFLVAVLLFFGLLEISARIAFRTPVETFSQLDERNLGYDFHPRLGWIPRPNATIRISGSREITAHHNSRGFRDREWGMKAGKRMMVLGDSFVWGYDVEEGERLTDRLSTLLPGWEVLNLGVSGFSTDQEFLLLEQEFDTYNPDIIVLVFDTGNDFGENLSGIVHRGYFKPFFETTDGRLELRGVPVPRSARFYAKALAPYCRASAAFRLLFEAYAAFTLKGPRPSRDPTEQILSAMKQFVAEKGARLLVGMTDATPEILGICSRLVLDCVSLETDKRYPENGSHWTPEGNSEVAEKLRDRLEGLP